MRDCENDISHTLVQVMLFLSITPNNIFYNFHPVTVPSTITIFQIYDILYIPPLGYSMDHIIDYVDFTI